MNEKNLIWNPFLEGYFENPHKYLRHWREQNPVHKGINECWILFKYEDVKFLLTDPIFKTWKTHEAVTSANKYLDESKNFDELSKVFQKVLLFLDPPEHTHLRGVIAKIWNFYSLQEIIQESVEESLEELSGKREIEIVADFARAVPTRIISKILGLPAGDYKIITNWSYQFISALEPFVSLHELNKFNRHAVEFHKYLTKIIKYKEHNPDGVFISRLLEVNKTLDKPVSNDEIISVLCMLFFAGIETSVNLLSQSILLLLENPEQSEIVRETDQLSASAANEFIRCVSPVNYTKRVATEDFEIRGKKIKASESLFGGYISANFDADVFENPEKLDLTRNKNPHLGFGHGSHFCLGAKLGREQISRSIPALFRRYPNMNLQSEKSYKWDKLIMNRALKSLYINLN